ncbi:MAG: glycoside hydrolase family 127 protein [Nibricoccus sp.]
MKKLPLRIAAFFAIASLAIRAFGVGGQPAIASVKEFGLRDVRLLDGPFKSAQEVDLRYMLALDVDRFMAPFRAESGLPSKAKKYPNWESTGLDGHSAGHYLTALAQMAVTTGDAEIVRRLDYMVSEMAACQRANGDGYVGGCPGDRELWRELAAGKLKVDNFSINGKWVPWYNLHKTFAGLRDAWTIAGNAQARDVLVALADWCDRLLAGLTDEQLQQMMRCEHGGMNEVLADVCAITGDAKYLALAKRFSHRVLLDPLLKNSDPLTGLHANTQIPKVIGFARIAELRGDPAWNSAAAFFWQTVVERRSVAFGGNSVREHFHPAEDFSSMVETREGPETCNTYNMLRLTEQLFRSDPSARYADYYERALFNHILSSQHPERGGFVYFTPIRPRHYRNYSQPTECFWCCVGSGIENHGKYGQFIYARTNDALYVNLFIASELNWIERDLKLRQETKFPDEERTRLVLSLKKSQRFELKLRQPSWVRSGDFVVRINGKVRALSGTKPGEFVVIDREWNNGDCVEIELPMQTTTERLPDGSDYVAVLRGPIVLAAKTETEPLTDLIANDGRMGHRTEGPMLPLDRAPMLVGDPAHLAEHIVPVKGHPMTFTAQDLIRPVEAGKLELVPFFRVHDSRYMIYWRTVTPEGHAKLLSELAVQENARLALEARTLDQVNPGEQQPEVEHAYAGDDSATGASLGRRWRDSGKWFGYTLRGEKGCSAELLVTYSLGENRREFDLVVNGVVVSTVKLNGRTPDKFDDVSYSIPDSLAKDDGTLEVKFVAKSGSRTGSIYGIRLLKKP